MAVTRHNTTDMSHTIHMHIHVCVYIYVYIQTRPPTDLLAMALVVVKSAFAIIVSLSAAIVGEATARHG